LQSLALPLTVSGIRPLVASNISLNNAAKPLQMETQLLLTAYTKSPLLYSIIPTPTAHDLPFSHNTARLACRSAL